MNIGIILKLTLLCLIMGTHELIAAPQASPTASAAAAQLETNSGTPVATAATSPEMLIASGDLLQVKMYGVEEFAADARVNASGEISLPLIGLAHVAGLPTGAAERLIENKLKDGRFYVNPQISITQKEYTTQGISVLGEVQKPGILPLLGQRKLFDVISAAGGTTVRAGNTVLISHRENPSRTINVTLSKDPAKAMESNVSVLPGDTIFVTKAGIVYVVGDVRVPGGFIMDNGNQMTVLQAISMAQGTNPTASLNGSKLIRKTPKGPQEIPLSLTNIFAGKERDQTLQDEDIVFV